MSNIQFNSSYKGREIEEAVKRANEIIPNQIKDLNAKTEVLSKQKADIKSVPKRVSQLENDSNFVTKNDVKTMVDDINSNLDNIDNINIIATEGANSIVQKIEGTTSITHEIVFEEYPRAGESFDFDFNMTEDIDTANVVVNVYGDVNNKDSYSEMFFHIELNGQMSSTIDINTLLSSEYIQLSNVSLVNKGKNTLNIISGYGVPEGTQIPIQKIVIRGKQSNVTGSHSVAFGRYNKVSGNHSMAVDYNNTVEADNAFVAGSSNIIEQKGKGSFVAGHCNTSNNEYQAIYGTYSDTDVNDAFVIGNGDAAVGKRNAFKITKQGDAHITKDLNVLGKINVGSDVNVEGNVDADYIHAINLSVDNICYTAEIESGRIKISGVDLGINEAKTLKSLSCSYNNNFSKNTLEQVVSTIRAGIVPPGWKVGDELVVNIAGKDRTIVIIGINADKFADGTVAPFTFHFKELYSDWYAPMYNSGVANNGWEFSTMRTKTLPNILEQFPQVLRDSIDTVIKYTEGSDGKTQITEDKLFLLAFPELSTCLSNNVDYCPEIPSAIYPTVYSTNPLRAKYIYPNDNITDEDNKTLAPWLMRNADGSSSFRCIAPDLNNNGQYSTRAPIDANTDIYFAPAFCISNKFALHIGDTILDEDVVKKMYARTEYATADKAGVVKVKNTIQGKSGLIIEKDGSLSIFEAMEGDFGSNYPAVITVRNLDKAVKYVGDGYYALESDTNSRMNEIESIAKGRATGYVFDTVEDLDLWLEDEANISKLKLGDNLYIRAKEVPDYWWDGESKQELETQKVDLTEYVKNTELDDVASSKQDKITGTSGQFVVIGVDGNIATKTIAIAEEATF